MRAELQRLRAATDLCLLADRHALRRRIAAAHEQWRAGGLDAAVLEPLRAAVEASLARVAARRARVPASFAYPEELPVVAARERILEAVLAHQVVIVAGDTGSGKTTQLPKICLEAGRGVYGQIGHTQPRRIAAQAVAGRIAEELGTVPGEAVGYQVRFTDRSSPETLVKLMTDGILLMEIQHDRRLERYDTLIIDEAHERSLNIDFILGYLKRLLPERPDLKLIITSATIDVERFALHFGGAPVISVEGRTWPVELRYRGAPEGPDELPHAIVDTIAELIAEDRGTGGDMLVFHAGERDIRETALAIRKADLPQVEVLPLYSRLGQAEQAYVLRATRHSHRRIVLATNVAETSITVPGIRYVIDPGFARISRYSVRSKVQRLPIEPVSRASAAQRAGRCGRVAAGICVRLYDEADFLARPEFTDPEIRRTNLAAVVLQMQALGLGDIARFPFLDPPDERQINDGVRLLEEIGALHGKRLTGIGRKLARLPVDPRVGRMLLAGAEFGALAELLVIAAFLSIQDPRERPADKQQAADQSHRRFASEQSDFLAVLALWRYVEERRQELSQNQWRKACEREFLSFLRLREWRDIHHQLRLAVRALGLKENTEPAESAPLHRAVLAGMVTQVGIRTEERDYEGVRNRRFAIHPGSFLYRKQPKWVVSAELVDTTRLYARLNAAIEPEWIVAAAEHLLKREHHSPAWRQQGGKVMAKERLRLFGLVIGDDRSVDFARIDPVMARQIFIQSALVEGNYRSSRRFWKHNQDLLAEVHALEAKGRRRDLLVDERAIYDFYDERLPHDVCDHPTLERWLRAQPEALCMSREVLLRITGDVVAGTQFPDTLDWQGQHFALQYRYEPGHAADGVTVVVPLALLPKLPRHLPEWLVPGLLRDKLIALVKALPKQFRKAFVPVPDRVDALLPLLRPDDVPLSQALAEAAKRELGISVPREAWQDGELDAFYRMNLRIVASDGKTVAEGRDIPALQQQWSARAQADLVSATPITVPREPLKTWTFGDLPVRVPVATPGLRADAIPVLREQGGTVVIEPLADADEAAREHRAGLRRLLLIDGGQPVSWLRRNLLRDPRTVLRLGARFDRASLIEDVLLAAIDEQLPAELPRSQAGYGALRTACMAGITARAQALEELLGRFAEPLHALQSAQKPLLQPVYAEARSDIERQLAGLLAPGFLYRTPRAWLLRYPVYLQAIVLRIGKLAQRLPRDLECVRELQQLQQRLDERVRKAGSRPLPPACEEYRWLLEEYRVSLFAQQLGTLSPVSRKRLDRLWEDSLSPP